MTFFIVTFSLLFIISFTNEVDGQQFHYARPTRTNPFENMNVYSFEFLFGKGIDSCVESCKAKKLCKFISYDRRMELCYLIGLHADRDLMETAVFKAEPGFYFGNKSEWNMTKYQVCEECNEKGVCGLDDGNHSICLASGCGPPPSIEKTVILGNMYSIGNKVQYQCGDGFKARDIDHVPSICNENGEWSSVNISCLPGDILEFNNTCYLLIEKRMDWDDANESCNQMNGNLVNIESQEEQEFIETNITNVKNHTCYWTGGRIMAVNDNFSWSDGTAIDTGYNNWADNQPDYLETGRQEHCVDLHKRFWYKWNDFGCSKLCHVICENV